MDEREAEYLRSEILELINEERESSIIRLMDTLERTEDLGPSEENSFFASLLENYVHLDFSEEEAIAHWIKIIDNSHEIRERLGRKIGIHLAVVDYFTNRTHALNSPMLIEVHVFRQTERLAMIDGLTGIFNRRYMDIILKKEFNRCDRYGKALSVCIIDIDDFKRVNDTQGHVFGDTVLREIAEMLRESIREEDIVCRYGGEEFLVILPETDAAGAMILANRIRQETKTRIFFVENSIAFSAGTATYPSCAREMTELIQSADRALYQAKYAGKDRICAAIPERRKFGRYAKSWSLNLFTENGKKPITGIVTQNVSLGGIQFECQVKYNIDTPVHLVFTHQEEGIPEIAAEGRITWARRNRDIYSYGVSFLAIPDIFESTLIPESAVHANALK